MRISYDETSRGLLIAFGDPSRYRVSKEIVPGVVVDFDEDGKALAVELEDVAAVVDPREVRDLVYPRITKGADLKAFRERLGLTQEQLGGLIDIPRNTIARWEREELPIAKMRQLELALSAILRPESDRSFKIIFSEEEGAHELVCGFCDPPILIDMPTDDPLQIIYNHHAPDSNDGTMKIAQCLNWNRWKSSLWEMRSSDDGAVISQGVVRVSREGTITVEITSRASQSA